MSSATRHPRPTNATATAWPTPLPAPVTTAVDSQDMDMPHREPNRVATQTEKTPPPNPRVSARCVRHRWS